MLYIALLGDDVSGKAIGVSEIRVPGANDATDQTSIFGYVQEFDDLLWHCPAPCFPTIGWQEQDEGLLRQEGVLTGEKRDPGGVNTEFHNESVGVVGG